MLMRLEAVDFRYGGGTTALSGIDVSFGAGELVCVAGRNGSGKSTLLRLMSRIIDPTRGTIWFDGEPVSTIDRRMFARSVGYLAQNPTVAFPATALEIVLSGRSAYLARFGWETPADLELAHAALASCDVDRLAGRYLDEMSGGEKKRVFLARVLVGAPRVVLLDEPLAALDFAHVEQLLGLLRRIVVERKCSVIFVSHDLSWSSACADRVLVLDDGKLVGDGPPERVLTVENIEKHFGFKAQRVAGAEGRQWIVPYLP
ncbi:MAG TPA: ABC transporter ATP-binding protein [Thermoanaerobaculia bacterium]|nr:ABC transporter ATP-binding protein [Thermoanaerobaculia bacterium]